jgi:hypothetical protein
MALAGLSIGNIRLYNLSRAQSFPPHLFRTVGASQTRNIEPAFPSVLTLDTASSRISQTTTTEDLPVMPLTKYEI